MTTQNKIYIERQFNCSPAKLFEWLVQPKRIAQWFGPRHLSVGKVQTDVRVGGKYSIELHEQNRPPVSIVGEYLEINAPNTLVFSLRYQGVATTPPESLVKMKITNMSEGVSRLLFTQEFVSMPADMDRRTEAWVHMFRLLEKLIF